MKIKQCISPSTVHSEKATAYVAAGTLFKIKKQFMMTNELKTKVGDLLKFTIYRESDLRSKGYRFATLRTNRIPKKNALNKKKKSISKFGVVSPCMIVGARKCLNEGLEVIDEDGRQVTLETPGVDKILVIIDGGHRFVSVNELNQKRLEGDRIECYFTLPLNENIPIYELLRQSNIVTTPWDGTTYLSSLIMARMTQSRTRCSYG